MPYSADSENLPANIKKLPKHLREIFAAAFNASLDKGESVAFAIANAAVNKAKGKKRPMAAPSGDPVEHTGALDEDVSGDEEGTMEEEKTLSTEGVTIVADVPEVVAAPETTPPIAQAVEAQPIQQDKGNGAAVPADDDEGWSSEDPVALCPKCKKKVAIVEGKKGMVGKRMSVSGKCKECGGKVSYMPDEKTKESNRYVSELVSLREAKIDEANKSVELTIIKAGWSANDRYYSPDVLKEAADLFTNCKAFADHPRRSEDTDRPERSVRDIVGYYTKAWSEDGKVKAHLKVMGEAVGWLWPLIVETVNTGVDLVSTSINALGQVQEGEVDGRRGNIVQKIVKANSADVVTTAAAGGRFERLLASDSNAFTDDLLAAMPYDEWVRCRPDFAIKLREELKTARKDEADAALRKDYDTMKESLDAAAKEVVDGNTKLVEMASVRDKVLADLASLKEGEAVKIAEAVKAKETEVADLREKLAASNAEHLANKLLWEAALPDSLRAGLYDKVLGKPEAEARQIVESARAEARRLVLKEGTVHVQGTPALGNAGVRANPVASLMGVSVVPLANETAEEYVMRKRLLEAKGGTT
jgi:cation transport regulator ChaB